MDGKVYVGTSGFSYDDWVGPFYPSSVPKGKWFDYYVREFSCVEINATYYSWLATKTVEGLVSRAPVDFRFAVKLHRSLTHGRAGVSEGIRATIDQNLPIDDPIHLAQFPNGFRPTEESWQRIESLSELDSLVVEFRHADWQTDATLKRLRSLGISLCAVDAPKIEGLPKFSREITGDMAYIRLHGRNAEKWYEHDNSFERYNYLYSYQEVAGLAESISEMSERANESFVFFNNHYGAQAVTNARQLALELGVATNANQSSLFE